MSVEVKFQNVIITVTAESPKAAYEKLCDLFDGNDAGIEWTTDTYTTSDDPETERDTEELFFDDIERSFAEDPKRFDHDAEVAREIGVGGIDDPNREDHGT